MDAPLYLLVLCTALWCPLHERAPGLYTLTRDDCLAQIRLVQASGSAENAFCMRQGGYEIFDHSGRSRYMRVEAR